MDKYKNIYEEIEGEEQRKEASQVILLKIRQL